MRYATANIQALPFNHSYRQGIDAVMDHADVIGWQEMTQPEYLRHLQSKHGWGHSGSISYRASEWQLEKSGRTRLHPGTPAICPERPIDWVMLSRTGNPNRRVVITDRHYVSSAWNKKPDPDKALRKGMWESGNNTDLGLLKNFVQLGLPIVCMTDGNRMNYPIWGKQILDRSVSYTNPGGIDYLAFVNGDRWVWETSNEHSLTIPGSDHHARISSAALLPRK